MKVFTKKISVLAMLAAVAPALAPAMVSAQPSDPDGHFDAMLGEYCMDCHNFEDWAGGLDFETMSVGGIHEEAETWESVVQKLRGRLMPPPGNDQPDQQQIDEFVAWMESTLDNNDSLPVAGHVPLQRLSRAEYGVAIKALLGVEVDAADYLPTDIEVDGFDNIAEALTVSPAFTDQFVTMARKTATLAIGRPVPKMATAFYPVEGSQNSHIEGLPLGSRGGIKFVHNFPTDGEYRMSILDLNVGLYPRGMETRSTLVVLVDGEEVFRDDLGGLEDLMTVSMKGPGAAGTAEIMDRFQNIPLAVTAGKHEIVATFIERANGVSAGWTGGGFGGGGRHSTFGNGVQLSGPYNPTGVSMTESREKIFVCYPEERASAAEQEACAEQIIADLTRRAYRRPITEEDIASLKPFYEYGLEQPGGFDSGIEQVVAAVLASPDFMYRVLSPNKDIGDAEVFALNDLELATRLSYFLWSQNPDEELLNLAMENRLSDPEVLEDQIDRMLADRHAIALVDGFAMKWLNVDDLTAVQPDPELFRGFNDSMRENFSEEITRFMESILLEERPVTDLITASHTYLNESLARHYGVDGVLGDQFRRVELEDERRWGLLGKGAVLLRTSYGDRTSPVLRGAWVLEKIMGTPPTPPPPNVETDLSVPEGELATTVRARLEKHRDNPSCNQCHGVIDPIGLALENYTVLGQWRDTDTAARSAIDASTVLPTGKAIEGPIDLRNELVARPDMFAQAMAEKLLMYALNRELEYFDMPQVRAIIRQAADQNYTFASLVKGIVDSEAFRKQALPHGEEPVSLAENFHSVE